MTSATLDRVAPATSAQRPAPSAQRPAAPLLLLAETEHGHAYRLRPLRDRRRLGGPPGRGRRRRPGGQSRAGGPAPPRRRLPEARLRAEPGVAPYGHAGATGPR